MGGYEDLDEYEDEEGEGEGEGEGEVYEGEEYEEYEEEEDPEPKKEVQDYLVLRQRLKEAKRDKLNKELGIGNTPSPRPKSKDKYGSFFGSSQPFIADRVIQESKNLLENPDFLAKKVKSNNMVNKSSKSQAMRQSPQVASGITKKIQMLKDSRDYSFLESDDAQPPQRSKDPISEACLHQLPERNKDSSTMAGRKAPSTRDGKKPTPINGHVRPKVKGDRLAHADKHKKPSSNSMKPSNSMKQLSICNPTLAGGRKHIPGRPIVSKMQPPISKQSAGKGEHEESRKQKVLPRQTAHEELRKQKVLPKHGGTPLKQKVLPRQTAHEELRKQKVLPKQGGTPLKQKVTQPPPKSSAPSVAVANLSRKRPPRPLDDDDSAAEAINMIRNMFGYNPNRYRDEDYDDRDMEANFRQIEMEEKRSARIAKQEDEEELRKIEEEERRERLRKEAKKRKLR